MTDPVFGMQVGGDGSVLKVALGFVEVGTVDGGVPILLGPGQQSAVPAGGGPLPPEALSLDDDDEAAVVAAMTAEFPQPDIGPPDPAESATMSRIRERDEITVAIDEGELAEGVHSFATSLMIALSSDWDLGPPDVFPTDLDTALGALDAGEVDLVLTPVPPDTFARVPGFADPSGRLWSFVQLEDRVFGDGLTRTLAGLMTNGSYAEAYGRSFGSEPSYEQLRSILGF